MTKIERIIQKIEFDCDAWNINIIKADEYYKRKQESAKAIEQYVIKARIEESERYLRGAMRMFGKISVSDINDRLAELKKSLTQEE